MLPLNRLLAPAALAAILGLAACAGEQVDVSRAGNASLAPEVAGVPAATHAALESSTTPEGTYESPDGLVTGTYDRATGWFSLVKVENAPLVLRRQEGAWEIDAIGAVAGARYVETLEYDDGRERSYEVALVNGPLFTSLEWITEPGGNVVREQNAQIYPDGSWTVTYVDRDPDTAVEEDASGGFVVAADKSWTGTYGARWDDGSRLDELLWGVDTGEAAPIHMHYDWRDAATTVPDVDESADLDFFPADGSITGTRTYYGETGAPTCVEVDVQDGTYFEAPIDCP